MSRLSRQALTDGAQPKIKGALSILAALIISRADFHLRFWMSLLYGAGVPKICLDRLAKGA